MLIRRRETVDAADVARSAPRTGLADTGLADAGLADAGVGRTVRITGVDLVGGERLRLAAFGLRPGALVTVLARTAGGGHLIGLGAGRIVLDHRTAGRLAVRAA